MTERRQPSLSTDTLPTREAAAIELLSQVCRELDSIVFATSLGAEDMVLTEIIRRERLPIRIFTLDTGRLPAETLELIEVVERHYGTSIERYAPHPDAIADYVSRYGVDGFYDSVPARQACCRVRKLEPLKRALAGQSAWVTGLRAEQSVTRAELPAREWQLLEYLLRHLGKVVSKDHLVSSLSGWEGDVSGNAVEVYVSRLRVKLAESGLRIRTVRGFGYMLEEEPADAAQA